MSLVNQMLQDLEHRRTAEASVSPLGGLSSSGVVMPARQSINYLLLGAAFMLAIAVAFAMVYLFGPRQQILEMPVFVPAEKSIEAPKIELEKKPENPLIVAEAKHAPLEKKLATHVKPVVQPMVKPIVQLNSPAGIDAVTREDPVSLKVAAMNNVGTDAGLISIRKTANINEDVTQSVVSKKGENNHAGPSSVNKTIRPLTSEQQAQVAFQVAVKLLGRGDESGAQQKLEKALSIEPIHMRARETLAALLLNTGRVSEAAEKLSEGLRLRPTSTPLAKLYARVLVDQGDNDAAVAVLERARPLASADPDYYALLAVLYRGVGKHAQASQMYQQILQVRPGVAVWWMGLALSEDAMGSSVKALEAYQRAQRSGGLKSEVLQYVQSRIVALTPSVSKKSSRVVADYDGLED